jgi:hypothetical protein
MGVAGWMITGLGAAILVVAFLDVFRSVLCIDSKGFLVPCIHKGLWRLNRTACRTVPRLRREFLALAGPSMMVAIFVTWLGLFVIGFACVYWPHLQQGFRSETGLGPSGFVDALYFSGKTGTLLGFADIRPVVGWLKLVSVLQSGLGFALLTGMVAYLLNVLTGVTGREALAVRLRVETAGTGKGVDFVTHALPLEELSDFVMRLSSLRRSLHMLSETMQRFPVLDLFYRARNPEHEPERMIETLSEIALSARLAAAANPYRRVRPAADDFVSAVTCLLLLMANQHLPPAARAEFAQLKPQAEDLDHYDQIKQRLERSLGITINGGAQEEALLMLAARTRVLLQALDSESRPKSGIQCSRDTKDPPKE